MCAKCVCDLFVVERKNDEASLAFLAYYMAYLVAQIRVELLERLVKQENGSVGKEGASK